MQSKSPMCDISVTAASLSVSCTCRERVNFRGCATICRRRAILLGVRISNTLGCCVPAIDQHLVRFEGFELDTRTGELRKDGINVVRLSKQPLRMLVALLERPGEVVLREDLRKRLWPNDTIVEFEHSINSAMKRLRQALGDSADNPRFIETLARRGYRWKTPVQWIEAPEAIKSSPISADYNLV